MGKFFVFWKLHSKSTWLKSWAPSLWMGMTPLVWMLMQFTYFSVLFLIHLWSCHKFLTKREKKGYEYFARHCFYYSIISFCHSLYIYRIFIISFYHSIYRSIICLLFYGLLLYLVLSFYYVLCCFIALSFYLWIILNIILSIVFSILPVKTGLTYQCPVNI